jgi:hypothetical protein
MEEGPELEAGIRNRQIDAIVASLLPGIVEMRMLVHIEHAPDLVIAKELIPQAPRFPLGLSLLDSGSLDQSFGDASLIIDLHPDRGVSDRFPQVFEVARLRYAALADDQDTPA